MIRTPEAVDGYRLAETNLRRLPLPEGGFSVRPPDISPDEMREMDENTSRLTKTETTSHRLSFRLSDDLHEAAKAEVEDHQSDYHLMSQLLRDALKEKVKHDDS